MFVIIKVVMNVFGNAMNVIKQYVLSANKNVTVVIIKVVFNVQKNVLIVNNSYVMIV